MIFRCIALFACAFRLVLFGRDGARPSRTSDNPGIWRGNLCVARRMDRHVFIATTLMACAFATAQADESVGVKLALRLAQEGDPVSAAIEFRRLAMNVEDPEREAAYYWSAAHHYYQAHQASLAERMLNEAEQASDTLAQPIRFLRAETALAREAYSESVFYWESILRDPPSTEEERWARRQLAAIQLRQGKASDARDVLKQGSFEETGAMNALRHYEEGRDKNPALGGWLGVIPGLGYAYAGEYANALRSLILNSIFIYGMVDTAQNDHWGGFAVITFFEITWFTGSIYGGIDASHRYNERRLEDAVNQVVGEKDWQPDWSALPVVSYRIRF
jgi:hypothetical protein